MLIHTRSRGTGKAKDPMWRRRVCSIAIRFAYSRLVRVAAGAVQPTAVCFLNREGNALRHHLLAPHQRQVTRKTLGHLRVAKSNDIYRPTDSDDRVATATNEGCELDQTELVRNNAPAMTAPLRG